MKFVISLALLVFNQIHLIAAWETDSRHAGSKYGSVAAPNSRNMMSRTRKGFRVVTDIREMDGWHPELLSQRDMAFKNAFDEVLGRFTSNVIRTPYVRKAPAVAKPPVECTPDDVTVSDDTAASGVISTPDDVTVSDDTTASGVISTPDDVTSSDDTTVTIDVPTPDIIETPDDLTTSDDTTCPNAIAIPYPEYGDRMNPDYETASRPATNDDVQKTLDYLKGRIAESAKRSVKPKPEYTETEQESEGSDGFFSSLFCCGSGKKNAKQPKPVVIGLEGESVRGVDGEPIDLPDNEELLDGNDDYDFDDVEDGDFDIDESQFFDGTPRADGSNKIDGDADSGAVEGETIGDVADNQGYTDIDGEELEDADGVEVLDASEKIAVDADMETIDGIDGETVGDVVDTEVIDGEESVSNELSAADEEIGQVDGETGDADLTEAADAEKDYSSDHGEASTSDVDGSRASDVDSRAVDGNGLEVTEGDENGTFDLGESLPSLADEDQMKPTVSTSCATEAKPTKKQGGIGQFFANLFCCGSSKTHANDEEQITASVNKTVESSLRGIEEDDAPENAVSEADQSTVSEAEESAVSEVDDSAVSEADQSALSEAEESAISEGGDDDEEDEDEEEEEAE